MGYGMTPSQDSSSYRFVIFTFGDLEQLSTYGINIVLGTLHAKLITAWTKRT